MAGKRPLPLDVNYIIHKNVVQYLREFYPASCETSTTNFALSVTVRESVPEAKSYGQLLWLKLGTEVGCDEISQKSVWLSSLTSSSVFSVGDGRGGGCHVFFSFDHLKSSLQGEIWKVPFNSFGKLCCHMNSTMDSTMELSVRAC